MSRVILSDKRLLINGEPTYLRSGTVQYWGVPRSAWGKVLDDMVEARCNAVEAYFPWFWHEPVEGEFDLTGKTHPLRDARAFLQLAQERGLFFIARPGPFINSELRYGGHPHWLFENHPNVWSHRADGGRAFWIGQGTPTPSQLYPEFLQLVDGWYGQIVPLLVEFSIDNGGNVVLFQPDNEMNLCFTYGLEGSLYDEHILGKPGHPGLWHRWLLENIGDVEVLNQRYGMHVRDVAFIPPPREKQPGYAAARLVRDWLLFKQWHIFEFAWYLTKKAREHGLEVPVVVNEPVNKSWVWGGGEHAESAKFWRQHEGNAFTAGHTYLYGGEMDILGTSGVVGRLECVKTSDLDGPVASVEMGCGWYIYGEKTPALYNWDMSFRTQLGHGLDLLNIYTYAGRQNPPGSTKTGGDYDFQAPVTADGSKSFAYTPVKEFFEFVEGWEAEILQTAKVRDVRVALFTDLALFAKPFRDYSGGEDVGKLHFDYEKGEMDLNSADTFQSLEELVKVLVALNVNFEFVNLNNPSLPPDGKEPLIVPNPGVMSPEGFGYIEKYLENGGKVLFYPLVPGRDTDFNLQPAFTERLGLQLAKKVEPAGWQPGDTVFRMVDGVHAKDVALKKNFFLYEPKSDADVDILATHGDKVVAFKQAVAEGEIVVMGVYPQYLNPNAQAFFWEILKATGVGQTCRSEDGLLHVVQRASTNGSDMRLVTITNAVGRPSETKIQLQTGDGALVFPKLSDLELYQKSARALWVNVDLGYAVLCYSTSELVPLDDQRLEFEVRGDMLTVGEVAFNRKVAITIDGHEIPVREYEGQWIAVYSHGKQPARMKVQVPSN